MTTDPSDTLACSGCGRTDVELFPLTDDLLVCRECLDRASQAVAEPQDGPGA